MPQMQRVLEPSDVTYGKLYLSELQGSLPAPMEPVTVIDADGEAFHTHMHRTVPRIDGLTQLFRKHRSRPGETVLIAVQAHQPRVVWVWFFPCPPPHQ